MCLILLIILLYTSVAYNNKMISKSHWYDLQSYILSKDTSSSMRRKVNYIIFQRHIPLVYKLTSNFQRLHFRKSKNIIQGDMLAFAFKGLNSAVRKYNGNSSFVKYAKIYINGALFDALTEHNPISVLTKNERRRKIYRNVGKDKLLTNVRYKSLEKNEQYFDLRVNTYLKTRDYLASKVQPTESEELYLKKWEIINTFEPFVKRCFHYKFDFYFNKIRTNRHVGELMCCSEELVRRYIANHILLLTKNYTYVYT